MANDVNIRIVTKYIGAGFDKLAKQSKKLSADFQKEWETAFGPFNEQAQKQAAFGALGAVTAGVAAFGVASVKAADEASRVESAFLGISGGATEAAKNMEAMRRATNGLVSETEQQTIANQLLGMGIASSSEQLEEVVTVSRRLGSAFKGLGAKDAADEFALMMANMSVERLDAFGISSGKVRARIDEMLKSGEAANREQAFFNAAMEEAQKVMGKLGPEVETLSAQYQRLQASNANLQEAFGKLLLVGGDGGVLGMLTSFIDELTRGATAWDNAISSVSFLGDVFGDLSLSLSPTTEELKNFGSAAAAVFNPLAQLERAGTEYAESLGQGQGMLAAMRDAWQASINPVSDLVSSGIQLVTTEESLNEAVKSNTDVVIENTQAAEEALAVSVEDEKGGGR